MPRRLVLLGHYPPPVVLEPGQSLLEALIALDQRGVRHGVVVDAEGRLEGILSIRRLLSAVASGYRGGGVYGKLSSGTVGDVMWRKPPHVVVGEFGVEDVVYIMSKLNIGAVVVVDGERHVLGIISEKHIAGVMAEGPVNVAVNEVMSRPVRSLPEDAKLIEAVELMDRHRYRHVPVVDGEGRLAAMLTARDVLAYIAAEKRLEALREGRDEEVLGVPVSEVAVGNPVTAGPGEDVGTALRRMRRRGISALPVVDEERRPVGIISERDIVVRLPKLMGVELFYDVVRSRLYVARVVS